MATVEPTPEQLQGMSLQGRLLILEQILMDLLALSEYRPSILERTSDYLEIMRRDIVSKEPDNRYINEMLNSARGCLDRIARASE
ncbi:hypothetical protein [Bosea sp. BIWAKO-01]|uniref:hypothetical protein n=1 Tax=Bosea sp. BIWAKO-01 TaxID=506668 RepID=UPI000869F978|nr:hypothetical protein [Bosea sp. BIWAKO-01]GAU82893.1 hypothetical protein BIWAKO_02816 [Bosea sp. BIWAKO-01]